jgi:hypothetical protein
VIRTENFLKIYDPIGLLSTEGKVILNIVQRHIEEGGLLNGSQFDFCACQSTALQCMGLMDHVTLNDNKNMSMAEVFLDIKKAFDKTQHPGLLYKLYKLKFSTD